LQNGSTLQILFKYTGTLRIQGYISSYRGHVMHGNSVTIWSGYEQNNIPFTINPNVYYLLTLTRASNTVYQCYLNNSFIDSKTNSQSVGTYNLYIGADYDPNSSERLLDGVVRRVLIYDRVLSSEEVSENYNTLYSQGWFNQVFTPPSTDYIQNIRENDNKITINDVEMIKNMNKTIYDKELKMTIMNKDKSITSGGG